jgi:hypothetical protein
MQEPVTVTIAPPDAKVPDVDGKRVNLYLYHVSENAHLKNQEIPGQGHPGAYGLPPLSLDLYYLVTAFGQFDETPDADLHAQRILGDAMRVLHDFPIITEKLLKQSTGSGSATAILDDTLAGEFERVRITLQPMTLEDLSKLWTAMPQANFRCSVVYRVSVAQIESRRARSYPRPVGELPLAGPRVYALPLRTPHIDDVRVILKNDPKKEERPFPYARIGDTLVIRGYNLSSETTRVSIAGADVTIGEGELEDERIQVAIPDDPQLQPGPVTVKVTKDVLVRTPPESSTGFSSNLAVFMLVPAIETCSTAAGGEVSVEGTRLYTAGEDCVALVDDQVIRADDYATKTPTKITFVPPVALGSGPHPVRVRVRGAENIKPVEVLIP